MNSNSILRKTSIVTVTAVQILSCQCVLNSRITYVSYVCTIKCTVYNILHIIVLYLCMDLFMLYFCSRPLDITKFPRPWCHSSIGRTGGGAPGRGPGFGAEAAQTWRNHQTANVNFHLSNMMFKFIWNLTFMPYQFLFHCNITIYNIHDIRNA